MASCCFPGATFPFAYETQTDPFTGKSDGTFARCAARGNCPKLIHTVSSTEYWQGGHSLVTTDPLGRSDGTPPDNVRIYHFAGTQHGGVEGSPGMQGVCAMPSNRTDYRPFLRAALANLDRWVKDGVPAPREPLSAHRRRIIGGATHAAGRSRDLLQQLRAEPAAAHRFRTGFRQGHHRQARCRPRSRTPIACWCRSSMPTATRSRGLRLPDITVPTGTAAGWNVRAPAAGAAGELCYLEGSFLPFAKTKAEREAKNDPRPSLEERYKDRADYADRIRQAAAALQRDRYLLEEDVARIVNRASSLTW